MFVKRDDGLGRVFIPYHIAALIAAAGLTALCRPGGMWAVPVFIGWYLASFIAAILLYYLFLYVFTFSIDRHDPPKEDHPFRRKCVVRVIGQLCRYGRLRIHLTGAEKLPEGRFLVVSNHRSGYDPISTVWALRSRDLAFITKSENHRIPIAGPLIFGSNYLPIDRENPREAMKTISAAADLLINDVVSVGVYPEGTRGREADMLPFHNGVFKIAQKAKTPLVVATVRGAEDIGKNLPWRDTDVHLRICEVIPAEELGANTAALSERVRAIIENDLQGAGEQFT